VLGAAGNCKNPEKNLIDVIVSLEEQDQAILMEIMLKYIPKDSSVIISPEKNQGMPSPEPKVEIEMIESLKTQLQQKELERISMLEHVKKIEQENLEMAKRVSEIQKDYKEISNEKQKDKDDLEDYKNKLILNENSSSKIQAEREMEEEIERLTQETVDNRKQMEKYKKEKESEIEKLKDEIANLREKIKLSTIDSNIIDQLKKKVDDLNIENTKLHEELQKAETFQIKILNLEKDKKRLEEKFTQLTEELFTEKNETKKYESEVKKIQDHCENLEKNLKIADEKRKFAESQAQISADTLAAIKKESSMTRSSGDASSLLSLEKEASYNDQIQKLKKELEESKEIFSEKSKSKIAELEAKLNTISSEKQKLDNDFSLQKEHLIELEKENEDIKSQLNMLKEGKEKFAENVKEFQRIKKDRDTLLDVAKRAQDTLLELGKLKETVVGLEKENTELKQNLSKVNEENIRINKENNKFKEEILNLEKKATRDEQKRNVLQEEYSKLEKLIESNKKQLEQEFTKKLEAELSKQKITIKQKHKQKTHNVTVFFPKGTFL